MHILEIQNCNTEKSAEPNLQMAFVVILHCIILIVTMNELIFGTYNF